MQLKYEVRTFRNKLGGSIHVERLRAQSRIELAENIVPFGSIVSSHELSLSFGLVRHAWHGVLHPLRSRRPHPNLPMMQYSRISRAHFGGLDPHILRKISFHQDVFVVNRAGGRKLK